MNHFQRLNEVKELKIFFFAQRANTRKQAAMSWRQQSRTAQARGDRMTCQCTDNQQRYTTARPWLPGLIVGPCPSEESLCCPACPPALPCFRRVSAPSLWRCVSHFLVFALHLYVSYVQSHHFPWLQPHELQSIRSSRLTAVRTHHPISHVSLGEAPSRLPHTVFPPKGLLLSGQGGCSRRPYQG